MPVLVSVLCPNHIDHRVPDEFKTSRAFYIWARAFQLFPTECLIAKRLSELHTRVRNILKCLISILCLHSLTQLLPLFLLPLLGLVYSDGSST